MDISHSLLAVVVEVIFMPKKMEDRVCRGIFDKISDNHGIISYTNAKGIAVMSSAEEKSNLIRYRIAGDRMLLTYEFTKNSLNYYNGLIGDFIDIFAKDTGINVFAAHNTVIRKNAKITDLPDSREYLLRKVLGFDDAKLTAFKRPLHLAGTRIFFPPIKEDKSSFDIKIESSLEDPRNLFIENRGIFAYAVDYKKNRDEIARSMEKTDKFIAENVMDFLSRFDKEA
ncbi:MAG TPA: hypothetical protein ENN55_04855 [Firmicutes bacterium]|nr:hypothetical protein [Bacillota bacterium]